MKTIIKSLIILIIFIFTVSCSKNDDNVDNTTKVPYLTSYKFSYSPIEFELKYNPLNKLISFETLNTTSSTATKINNEIIKNSNGLITKVGNSIFTYNTSNQIIKIDNGTGDGTTQLQYDTQGRLISQNTIYFGGVINETKNLTYDATNRISQVNIHAVGTSVNTYYRYIIIYDTKNNISGIITRISPDNVTYTTATIFNYFYDDKVNPLKTVTNNTDFADFYIAPSSQFDFFSTETFSYIAAYKLCFISSNNLTRLEVNYASGGENTTTYEYTYNEYGYPTKVIINDDEDGTYSINYNYTIK
jgi:YD repeat-containing protein